MRVGVSIVNYNSSDLTMHCLDSLRGSGCVHDLDIVVVDNDSTDGSAEKIEDYLVSTNRMDNVTFIRAERNGGFAYGNNIAFRHLLAQGSQPDYILLLNPDTVVLQGAIDTLVDFLEKHQTVGIAGSQMLSAEKKPQVSGFRFHSLKSEVIASTRLGILRRLFHNAAVAIEPTEIASQVDWVAGASMLVRRELIETTGLMDEGYFLYFEETDYCLTAARNGWQCWYVPASKVIHYEGKSTGIKSGSKDRKRRPQYWFESRQRYFRKNHGYFYTALVDFIWMAGFISWRTRRLIQRKPDHDPEKMLWDFLKNSVFLTPFRYQQSQK